MQIDQMPKIECKIDMMSTYFEFIILYLNSKKFSNYRLTCYNS